MPWFKSLNTPANNKVESFIALIQSSSIISHTKLVQTKSFKLNFEGFFLIYLEF